jgi:hypothetical protein
MNRIQLAVAFAVFTAVIVGASYVWAAEGDAALIKCADGSETTYAKEKCEKEVKGKTMNFEGEVFDIVSAKVLTVKLDNGNYATVTFKKPIADEVSKGDTFRFSGKVEFVGSGIMFYHRVKQAVRLP